MNKEVSAKVQKAIVYMIALLRGYEGMRSVAINILEDTEGEEFPNQKVVKDFLETLVQAPNPFDSDVLDPLLEQLDIFHNLELLRLLLIVSSEYSQED